MATATTSIDERVSKMEGAYDHLATKPDLAQLESRLTWKVAGLQIASMVAIAAILIFLT